MRCLSACAVHRPNGTRARNVPFRIASAPLRNREIAFGGGRFPVRRISHRCVPLKGAVGRAVGTGARRFSARLHSARMLAHPSGSASPNLPSASLRRISANPPSSARGNPSAATARLAWSRSLPAPIASVPAASCPSRRRIRSGPVAGTPRPLRAIGTCPFLRCAFRAPYSEQSECVGS